MQSPERTNKHFVNVQVYGGEPHTRICRTFSSSELTSRSQLLSLPAPAPAPPVSGTASVATSGRRGVEAHPPPLPLPRRTAPEGARPLRRSLFHSNDPLENFEPKRAGGFSGPQCRPGRRSLACTLDNRRPPRRHWSFPPSPHNAWLYLSPGI